MRTNCVDSAFQSKLQEASIRYARQTVPIPEYHSPAYMRIRKEYYIKSHICAMTGIAVGIVCNRILDSKYRKHRQS